MKKNQIGWAALLVAISAEAGTYYVAPGAAGNDNNAGTLAAPFATMTRGQSAAMPGDTVYFRGGTYSITSSTTACQSETDDVNAYVLSKNGAAGSLIHYFAYPGETPVFDFTRMKQDCRIRGIWVSGDWIHVRGLEIEGVPQNNNQNHENWGVWVTGSFNIFERLNVHHISGAGIFIQKGAGNLVLNCDSHHNYDSLTSNGAGQSADGFGCHVSAGDTGNVFRGDRAWMNSDDGFDLINAFAPVTIENCWAWQMGYLPGTLTPLAAGNGNGFKAGGYGTDPSTFPTTPIRHTVRNCLAFNNKAAGVYTNHHPYSCYFYNNTSFGNHPDFNMLGMNTAGGDITVGVFRNNLAYSGTLLSNETYGGRDDADNSWTLSVTVANADFQSVATTGMDAPRQADGSLPIVTFMHLVQGSDLIDKGVNLGLPFAGAAPDLGAFEYGAPSAIFAPNLRVANTIPIQDIPAFNLTGRKMKIGDPDGGSEIIFRNPPR